MAGNPIRRARREKAEAEALGIDYVPTPTEKSWKVGKPIKSVIQGIPYETPPVPEIKKIRGHHLPKEEQVWYRDTTYEKWDWNTDPKLGVLWHQAPQRGQMEWFIEEVYKLHNGEWVFINGFPTYFNKYCRFFHQWFILQEGIYPIYKDTSLEYFNFYKLCEDDDFTLGDIGIKGRRVGLSSMSASISLLIGLLEDNTLQGIVSKTGTDAKEMYLMVKGGLEGLPEFLIPELAKVAETELHIAKPRARISTNNRTVSSDKGKNNRINWLPTSENSYDGRRTRKVTLDECMSPDTKILCDGYEFREIKDIKVGDHVIVEGGKRKRVAKVFNGYDEMFLIKQPYSQDYIVSSKHRLYLEQRCSTNKINDDGIKIITPIEAINLSKYKKRTTYGVRSSGLELSKINHLIDPYIFGAWIGDGYSDSMSFIVNHVDDIEIYEHIKQYGESIGFRVSELFVSNSDKVVNMYYVKKTTGGLSNENPLIKELKRLNVFKNKHIPKEYLLSSKNDRLELLAGIIDADGCVNTNKGTVCIAMSRKNLIDDIIFLCRSLGFSVSKRRDKRSNFDSNVYKISISGDLSKIPLKIERKKLTNYVPKYKFRRNRIEVSSIGVGEYVGIQVEATNDDDRRLILEDFTLTMNCAKWEEADIQITLSKISKTLVVGASCVGQVSMFSSVNKGDKGGDNFKKVWLASNHMGKLDSIGQTPTRMKRFFLEGYRGFYGYIDKYGNSVVENPTPEQIAYLEELRDPTTGKKACPNPRIGAKEYLQEKRNNLAYDPELLSEEIRQFPFEWIEVFRGVNNLCHFNLEDLTNQIERIETLLEGTGLSENGRRGRFKKNPNGDVTFEDSNSGMWYILEFVPDNNNKSVYQGSIKCPDNTIFGSAGLDPFANSRQTVDKGSDACCIVHKRYDSLDPENSDYPCAMFLGRPDTKQEFFNQIYWGLEYYGIRLLGERAPTDWIDYAMHPNNRLASPETAPKLHGYLISTKRANNSEVYGCAPQDKEAREQHLTEQIEYAQNNMRKIKFLRLLRDMLGFNINDRTDYDACMAFGYALMGLKSDFRKKEVEPKVMNFMQVRKSKKYY